MESFYPDREGVVSGDGGDMQCHDDELGRARRVVGAECGHGVHPPESLHEGIHRRGRTFHHCCAAGVVPEGDGLHGGSLRLGRRGSARRSRGGPCAPETVRGGVARRDLHRT